jgi:hypothetical protein
MECKMTDCLMLNLDTRQRYVATYRVILNYMRKFERSHPVVFYQYNSILVSL